MVLHSHAAAFVPQAEGDPDDCQLQHKDPHDARSRAEH